MARDGWGWIEMRAIGADELAELKEQSAMIANAKPWLDPRYK
jgi:hypothetical protein